MAQVEMPDDTNLADKDAGLDFKMITFMLANKEYGVDIMHVREIQKGSRFTYVPNAQDFVRGVYNLRGEIISVIDLRRFFGLPANEEVRSVEDILILKFNERTIGLVVDSIEKVVSVDATQIQPIHPLFADIHINYIYGMIERDKRLYIIIDAYNSFFIEDDKKGKKDHVDEIKPALVETAVVAPVVETVKAVASPVLPTSQKDEWQAALEKHAHFYVSPYNQAWFDANVAQMGHVDVIDKKAVDRFLQSFNSKHTESMWDDHLVTDFQSMFMMHDHFLHVWNVGCSTGHESYSLTMSLLAIGKKLKVFAQDHDLMAITGAYDLSIGQSNLLKKFESYVITENGHIQFTNVVKNAIMFELHDLANSHAVLPGLDIVVARDVLSFVDQNTRKVFFDNIALWAKGKVILIVGDNEQLPETEGWSKVANESFSVYKK